MENSSCDSAPSPMTDEISETKETREEPSLYQEFLAEREEVLRHKWIRSEEAGHDVGLDTALVDWVRTHRTEWKREWQAQNR